MNYMKTYLVALIFTLFTWATYAQADLKKIDKYIENARKAWNVPGMGVAIVKDGKVVLSKGYGVKELGKKEKVDENTLFAIASNSKAFVSSALAKLVSEKKIAWNDKVQKYLPYFRLYDNYTSTEATIADLLCHRVGLGTFSGDVIWYKSNRSAEEVVKHAAFVPKVYSFRNGYGYSNLMFITAGEVIKKVTGKTWAEYVKESFIRPLGMKNTVTSIKDLPTNAATPHKPTLGRGTQPIAWTNWDNMGAAGGIISSPNDMAQWMMMNLAGGKQNGKTILDEHQQSRLWTPHNNYFLGKRAKESLPGRNFAGYGLGWSLMDYHGNLIVTHGGGYDGMYSVVMMVPNQNLGIVVLTNTMEGISRPLAYYIINQYIKKDMRDWSAESLKRARSRNRHKEEVEERKAKRKMNTQPSVSESEIIGTYFDPMYGDISIKKMGNDLKLTFADAPKLKATLKHWHYDTYEIVWDEEHAWFDFGTVSVELDNNLKVEGLTFDVPNGDIFFHELHPKRK